jgi:hypothetical protein
VTIPHSVKLQFVHSGFWAGFIGDHFDVVDFVADRAQTINKDQQATYGRL